MEADITTQAVGLASSPDFSITTLFIRADILDWGTPINLTNSDIVRGRLTSSKHSKIAITLAADFTKPFDIELSL